MRISSPTTLRRYGSEKYPRLSQYRPKRTTLTSGIGRVSTSRILTDPPALLLRKRLEPSAYRNARSRHSSLQTSHSVCHGTSGVQGESARAAAAPARARGRGAAARPRRRPGPRMRRPVSTLGCEQPVWVAVACGVVGLLVVPDALDDSEPGAAEDAVRSVSACRERSDVVGGCGRSRWIRRSHSRARSWSSSGACRAARPASATRRPRSAGCHSSPRLTPLRTGARSGGRGR